MGNNEFNFVPNKNWKVLEKKDMSNYGIADLDDAKIVCCYKINNKTDVYSTVSLYYYGEYDNQIDNMVNDYKNLQINLKEQDEYGVFPLYFEKVSKNIFLSALKPVHNPALIMVDLFFAYGQKFYSFHINIDKNEKNLTLKELCKKYAHIGYCYDAIAKN